MLLRGPSCETAVETHAQTDRQNEKTETGSVMCVCVCVCVCDTLSAFPLFFTLIDCSYLNTRARVCVCVCVCVCVRAFVNL